MPVYLITTKYTASSLIRVEQMSRFYESGVRLIICNRPDDEAGPEDHSSKIAEAAYAAGMDFEYIPFKITDMSFDIIDRHTEAVVRTQGKVIAYCASGRRCVMAWAVEHAKTWPVEKLVAHAQERGIDISGMSAKLQAIHQEGMEPHPHLVPHLQLSAPPR